MSCDYDVYCETCDASLGLEVNRGDNLMHALIRSASLLIELSAKIDQLLQLLPANYEVRHAFHLYADQQQIDLGFFVHHQGHVLVVRDEYGRSSHQGAEQMAEHDNTVGTTPIDPRFRLGIVRMDLGNGMARQLLIAAPYAIDLCRTDSRLFKDKQQLVAANLDPAEVDQHMQSAASDEDVLRALEDRIIALGCEVEPVAK